jgi:type 1 glutamine amidotransferase
MKALLLAGFLCCAATAVVAAGKRIVFIAGNPSHAPGEHEHRAGCLLLQSCLQGVPGVTSQVYSNGWPADAGAAFADAAAIIVYCDGGGGHPLLKDNRLQTIGELAKRGVGLACLHYGVEPTREKGQPEFLEWIGGAFEIHWSVNPTWEADFKSLPAHPITRGVNPFKLRDEWYFNMRFREGMKGVTAILSAVPPASTTNRNDGPHEGNPAVRAAVARGEAQHVAWACERANGGRGFGFTGGHYHQNWSDDNFRKVMLNAILWVAKVDVPTNGVQSAITAEQLRTNLDDKTDRRK